MASENLDIDQLKFTLVTTVFNEITRLDKTIRDIEAQIILPDEIIITDAGSSDGTIERLEKWKDDSSIDIIVLQKPGCNVAEGRNLAIKNASNARVFLDRGSSISRPSNRTLKGPK